MHPSFVALESASVAADTQAVLELPIGSYIVKIACSGAVTWRFWSEDGIVATAGKGIAMASGSVLSLDGPVNGRLYFAHSDGSSHSFRAVLARVKG